VLEIPFMRSVGERQRIASLMLGDLEAEKVVDRGMPV